MAQADQDRKTLVRPAPNGFKPDPADKKIRLNLIPQKTLIRKADFLWFILELQNIGSKPIRITDPIFRGQGIDSQHIKFHIRFPDGTEGQPTRPLVLDDRPCPGMKLYPQSLLSG